MPTNKLSKLHRTVLTLLLLFSSMGWPIASASAQAASYAAVQTDAASIKVGDILPVSVVAANLTDAYSVDLGLTFDPTRLQAVDSSGSLVSTVVTGDLFSAVQGLLVTVANNINNGSGKIIYSCRIKTKAEGGQDTGVNITAQKTVISFYLKVIQAGSIQVNFDPSFASAEGHGILFSDSATNDITLSKTTNLILNSISPPQPVTGITVNAAGNATSVAAGSTLQMSATVLPANATDQSVAWSVTPGTGSAAIDPQSGILTGRTAGTVTVRATATDDSGVYGEIQIEITPVSVVSTGGGGGGGATVPAVAAPVVQTAAATGLTSGSIALNGSIVNSGGSTVTGYGFFWGTGKNDLSITLQAGTDNHSGAFTGRLNNLSAGTYYFQAFAMSGGGLSSGEVLSFTLAAPGQPAVSAPVVQSGRLSDVPTSYWAYDAIAALNRQNYISGYPDGTFMPDRTISRAELVSIIVKVMKLPPYHPPVSDFSDISPEDWCYGAVEDAVYAGMVKGYNDSFAPGDPVTREELAVILVNALGKQDEARADNNNKTDDSSISSWARGAVAVAVKYDLIRGYQDADGSYSFRPQGNATRAEACAMINNFLKTVLSAAK
jgi:hypothetical protein